MFHWVSFVTLYKIEGIEGEVATQTQENDRLL